jgi:aerobic-type carbon monoxide dehydrogenase small subunit (CoxS/CutS family)
MPQIKINIVEHTIDADSQMPLLWAIRDIVGLPEPNSAAASAPAPFISA